MMRATLFLTLTTLLTLTAATASAGDVLLQYYESRWETIEKKTADAFVAGYSGYWLPPPYKADSGGYSVGYDVFDRFNLGKPFDQTLYGTETGVKQVTKTAQRAGMKVYFDWVGNHNGFRDSSSPGFAANGDYPGFVTTLPGDVDGDFHGAFDGGDLYMRLSGLIDIAQEKNHVFIRQPVADNPQNIPNETPNPTNAKFYPDLDLPANSQGIHPFNLSTPLAGDPVPENATGLLLRHAQWMVEVIGADGFRLDAQKHMPTWFFNDFYDRALYERGRPDLNGNPTTPYSFGESFTSDFGVLGSYRRKDGYGNRDVLDFPLFDALHSVFGGAGFGDMRNLEYSSVDAIDGNANDGSAGVMFAGSHDEHAPALDNVAYAHILTRTGLPIVYFNALEFGNGRDFPKGGRGDALGGDFGDLIPRLVDVSRRYAKGEHRTRWIDEDIYVYERSNSLLIGLSDRGDSGYDERTVDTDFRNVTLVELTGAATDPAVNANGDIPATITIGGDGKATIRVLRNRTNDTQHNRGFVMYGLAVPQHAHTVNSSSVLPADPLSAPNGARRHTPLQVVTGNTLSVSVETSPTIAEDNALIRLDGGTAIDANSGLFITSGEFAGFEEFTGSSSPRGDGGTGQYQLSFDATALSEGVHFLETVAFLPRPDGSPAGYSSHRSAIYLDRLPPPVSLTFPGTTGTSDVQSQSYTVVASCPDFTADSMHVFFDQPSGYDFLGNVSGSNAMTRVDRGEFRFTWNNITPGDHSITIVAFEPTGNSSVTRFETVNAVIPQPNMALGVDTNTNPNSVTFAAVPGTISDRAYANDLVVRVDTSGGISFPNDFEVFLDIDGQTYQAVSYNSSLLPPVNRLVQNDQNLGDGFDEFRLLWRGYGTGNHSITARARLKSGSSPENSVPAIINVPESTAGPALSITSPSANAVLNQPSSISVSVATDMTARSIQAFLSQPGNGGPYRLLASLSEPNTSAATLQRAVSNYLASDALTGFPIANGLYTIKVVASTGLDGTGIVSEATVPISVTGFPNETQVSNPVIDGNILEFFNRTPLAVSAADGAGVGTTVSDFGADGSLTELHARVANNTLYLAVRGDMFNGSNPNNNATILYIDTNATSNTGAQRMDATSDLSDSAGQLRTLVSNSGFSLSPALAGQGVGFDAAIILDGTSPFSAGAFGFGSGGVAGSVSSFAELDAAVAFGRGLGSVAGAPGTSIAGPSGFEVAIPLAELGNPNPREMAFAVVTTSDGSFPSPNTLPENSSNAFDGAQVLDAVAQFPPYPALRLNEVFNGEPDWVEVHNPTGSTVPLADWSLGWSDSSGIAGTYALSGGNVPGSAHVLAYDGSLGSAPAGSVALAGNLPWSPDRAGSAALLDPYGIAVDFVRWSSTSNQPSAAPAAPGTAFTGSAPGVNGAVNRSLGRDSASTDTDTAADWAEQPPTPGVVNTVDSGIADWELF